METAEPIRTEPWTGPLALAIGLLVALIALGAGGPLLGALVLLAGVGAACMAAPGPRPEAPIPAEPASANV